MSRLGTCLAVLLLSSGLQSTATAEVLDTSVCSVLASPASFDGKVIRIKAATVVAGFDEFIVDGSGCNPAAAIWLAYPEGTRAKAGPAAFLRLQPAKNSGIVASASKRAPVTLQRDSDFERFDSLLATPYKSSAICLGCPRYTVVATLVGRLDGVSTPGVIREKSGKLIGLSGFGNLNLYSARLVLQAVSEVTPHEVNYQESSVATQGDSRRAGSSASPDQTKRAAAAFGGPGEDNGVTVGFGVANEAPPDEGATGRGDSPDGILFFATFDMGRIGKPAMSKAISHLGTHIADIRGGALDGNLNQAESRAWQATFGK
jgi:hypothetical protein